MLKEIGWSVISFPFKATCWAAEVAWDATPDMGKKMAKMALYVSAFSLCYQAYKHSPEVESPDILKHVKPIFNTVAPVVASGAGYVWNHLQDAVVDTATDVFTEIIPAAYTEALPLGREGVSVATNWTFSGLQEMAGVVANLSYGFQAGLAASLFAKFYAAPRIYKLCAGAPLPRWVREKDSRLVTPLSQNIESLKNSICKSKEPEPVLNEDVRKRIETIVEANKNILKNRGFFKNILLLGDAGTGKTMLAEKIARDSGFNYIKISGAEFAWYISNGSALKNLNELLAFIQESNYPTVLVIDEIDALLPNSNACKDKMPSRAEREFRSAFLAATGGKSNKLVIVGTTNFEWDMDQALLSRFNNRIQMRLPDKESRVKILTQYIDKSLGKIPERATCLNKESIERLADRTEGMSGRILYQFVDSLAMQRPASSEGQLTEESIEEVLGYYLEDLERDRKAAGKELAKREKPMQDAESKDKPLLAAESPQVKEESVKIENESLQSVVESSKDEGALMAEKPPQIETEPEKIEELSTVNESLQVENELEIKTEPEKVEVLSMPNEPPLAEEELVKVEAPSNRDRFLQVLSSLYIFCLQLLQDLSSFFEANIEPTLSGTASRFRSLLSSEQNR